MVVRMIFLMLLRCLSQKCIVGSLKEALYILHSQACISFPFQRQTQRIIYLDGSMSSGSVRKGIQVAPKPTCIQILILKRWQNAIYPWSGNGSGPD